MRVKHIWNYVPIPANIKLFVDRITFSRITVLYILFSVIHCLIQVVLQAQAFRINANGAGFLSDIITQGNASEQGFSVFGQDLRMCDTIPKTVNTASCQVVWSGSPGGNAAASPAVQNIVNGGTSTQATSSSFLPSDIPSASSASSTVPTMPPLSSSSGNSATSSVSRSLNATSTTTTIVKSTVTVTARPTLPVAALEPDGDDIDDIPFGTRTLTVQIRPSKSAGSGGIDDDTDLTVRKREDLHVISALKIDGQVKVKVGGLNGKDDIVLSEQCLVALNWPLARVDNTKREDIVFVGFSIWVLGMSIVAVLNESPPHIVASFLTHMLSTAWSAYQLVNTNEFHDDFSRLTTHGACGINLLPNYWGDRAKAEIPILALNALALLISAYLSWKLMKSFGWQTFKRIGASISMSHAYRAVLIFSIAIQLSVFFIVVAVALWIDQIYNGEIAHLTRIGPAFRAVTIIVLILMLPWLTLGWRSVRKENRIPMLIFLVLSFGYLVGWSAMFAAPSFTWTFVQWRFFSLMAVASVLLALATFVLGIICRLNFGKGLSRYLNGQEPLPGDDFIPATFPFNEKQDEEKVDFPSYTVPIPTFSPTYPVAPPPAYQFAPRTLGPRFNAASSQPFEPQLNGGLARQSSGSSGHSVSSDESSMSMKGRRWVIE